MKLILSRLVMFLPYLIVFLFSLSGPTDPDLGWHLKYGEYFVKHLTPLRDNLYSAMMPAYHWANTSWFTDVLTYLTFHFMGFLGLSLLGALVVTITFLIVAKTAKLQLWDQVFLFPFLLYLEGPVNQISFRGQQFSLLFVALLFYFLSQLSIRPKRLYFLVPTFFLWANLNGEFLFGLALFALFIAVYKLQQFIQTWLAHRKKPFVEKIKIFLLENAHSLYFLSGLFVLCFLATLLNPFGYGIHLAALSHVGSPLLQYIAEYLPFDQFSQVWWNQIIVGVFIMLGFLYLFFKGKVQNELPSLTTIILVFVLSFGVRRYAWPAYYLLVPLMRPLVTYFKPDGKKVTRAMSVLFLLIYMVLGILSKYPLLNQGAYTWQSYCQSQYILCSPKSANYLVSHYAKQDIFALYGWGGYLEWNYPQVKPVIDGRMHLWLTNGYSAFIDYYGYEQNFKDIDKSVYKIVYMTPSKPIYQRLLVLVKEKKWKQVYSDNEAGIFVRN